MADKISLTYDGSKRTGVLTFPNGRTLSITNVSEQQAKDFAERHGPEFQRRDCYMQGAVGAFERKHHE